MESDLRGVILCEHYLAHDDSDIVWLATHVIVVELSCSLGEWRHVVLLERELLGLARDDLSYKRWVTQRVNVANEGTDQVYHLDVEEVVPESV